MFAGLIEAKARIAGIERESGGIRLTVTRPACFDDIAIGDSISIDGCCLTIVAIDDRSMAFQAGEETLSKTNLGGLSEGGDVNCERALAMGQRIGGHLVSGHIDGMGALEKRVDNSDWSDMVFSAPKELTVQMANKGSIAVSGVSLTLVEVTTNGFSVALIPHTLRETTLGSLQVGDSVNLETDMLAKYVQQQLVSQGLVTARE